MAAAAADNGIWLGLLKWSLAHQDGTSPSPAQPLSSEDRQWLERVMKEGVRDDVKVMTACFEGLSAYLAAAAAADDPAAAERTLEQLIELQDITEQIDLANAFLRIGGPGCLLQAVSGSQYAQSVRCQAAACIAAMAQNNLLCQEAFIQAGAISTLQAVICSAAESGELRAKALGALSSVVRGHPAGELALVSSDGASMFTAALSSSSSLPLRRKAVFLMKALVQSDDDPLTVQQQQQQQESGSADAAPRNSAALFRPLLEQLARSVAPLANSDAAAAAVAADSSERVDDPDLREKILELCTECARRDAQFVQQQGQQLVQWATTAATAAAADSGGDGSSSAAEAELWSELSAVCSEQLASSS
jgi:hypothetical protein